MVFGGENIFLLIDTHQSDKIGPDIRAALADENSINLIEINSSQDAIELLNQQVPDCAIIQGDILNAEDEETQNLLIEMLEERFVSIVIVCFDYQYCYQRYLFAQEVLLLPHKPENWKITIEKNLNRRKKLLSFLTIDPITGLNNYQFLQQEITKQLNDLKRSHEPFVLIYVELDCLKELQAAYGYQRVSSIVKKLAVFLQGSIRSTDSVACYKDNNSFVITLPKTNKEDAFKLMNRLMLKFTELKWADLIIDEEVSITFSAKIIDVVDREQSWEHYVSLLPFTQETSQELRKGLLVDGNERENNKSRRIKIAVIDDDRLVREMLTRQLEDIGDNQFEVEIKSYPDGEDFFADPWHKQNERFILIIDRVMPKMDGLEVLHRIRTRYDRRRYLCVMLTSKDSEADISLAILKGANDYIIKPFSIRELKARINRLIRGVR